MSNEGATGEEVPEAVADWLGEVAEQRGVSEAELVGALLRSDGPDAGAGSVDERRLGRLEDRFHELLDDVRERVVQVKREADGKAPASHDHPELRTSVEQLAHEVGAVSAELEALDERVADGFENYEEVLTYLTETTDGLQEKVGRLASAVVDLRERAGSAAREEARRTALSHLAGTANRHGVDRARCEACEESVAIGLLVEPRCPHCDASFSSLEPRRGFFRTSVLHTGSLPALESAPDEALGELVDDDSADLSELAGRSAADAAGGGPPDGPPDATGGMAEAGPDGAADARPDGTAAIADGAAGAGDGTAADSGERSNEASGGGATRPDVGGPQPAADDRRTPDDLQALDGVGPAYAERLAAAGVPTLRALADADAADVASAVEVSTATAADWVSRAEVLAGDPRGLDGVGPAYGERLEAAGVSTLHDLARADPETVGEAIDVPASTVADWVSQARERTGED